MQHVEELGVVVDRQLTKLDRLCSAVEYLKFACDEDSHYQSRFNKLTFLPHLFLGTIGSLYIGSHT